MGFSLGKTIKSVTSNPLRAAAAVGTFGGSELAYGAYKSLMPSRPGDPNLPNSPTLTAPTLPKYPGFTEKEQSLLDQQQNYINSAQGVVGGYGNSAYDQASNAANMQAMQNYQNALQGKIDPNQMMAQDKQKAWDAMVQQAGQMGIQIKGKGPEGAASGSTAGNQMITDFNKRYGALEQNYNLQQQQFGLGAQNQALGFQNQQYQNRLGGYGQLQAMNQNLFNPYQQQTLGQYGVETNQAMMNNDINNQNLMNAYGQQSSQAMANYNNAMAGYQNNMGLISSGLGLAGTIGGAMIGGPAGASVGGQLGGMVGQGSGGGSYVQGSNPLQYGPTTMRQAYTPGSGYMKAF